MGTALGHMGGRAQLCPVARCLFLLQSIARIRIYSSEESIEEKQRKTEKRERKKRGKTEKQTKIQVNRDKNKEKI